MLNKRVTNRFFTSPDSTEIWNVFHADANSAGACDGTRYAISKKMKWASNGLPVFKAPEKLGTTLTGPAGE